MSETPERGQYIISYAATSWIDRNGEVAHGYMVRITSNNHYYENYIKDLDELPTCFKEAVHRLSTGYSQA